MTDRNTRPPGMDCPECETFIVMPIEKIIAASTFSCPNPDCEVELRLDARKSATSIDALARYAETMKELGHPLQ